MTEKGFVGLMMDGPELLLGEFEHLAAAACSADLRRGGGGGSVVVAAEDVVLSLLSSFV